MNLWDVVARGLNVQDHVELWEIQRKRQSELIQIKDFKGWSASIRIIASLQTFYSYWVISV